MSLPTIWTAEAGVALSPTGKLAGRALIASHDRELLTRMPRIIELTPTALRSYGGNYDEYQRQRMAEQCARAALEHAVTDRRRTRANA